MSEVAALNLPATQQKYGARLDVRDDDYVWCPVVVIKVTSDVVTVRFEGWDSSFHQCIPWKSSDRLAPLYSFTKSAKCLVNLLSKKRNAPNSHLWPCRLQFRMPHPVKDDDKDEEDCLYAEQFLREEPSVYIQPYSIVSLPTYVRDGLDRDGGVWLNAKYVKPWVKDPLGELGVGLCEGFDRAFQAATTDDETVGTLPEDAMEEGCLLKEEYRVNSREGAKVRDGSIQATSGAAAEEEEMSSPVARIRATSSKDSSGGDSKKQSGSKLAKEDDEEQTIKPSTSQKVDEGHSVEETNVVRREEDDDEEEESGIETETDDDRDEDDSDDEDWVEQKPPAKKQKTTTNNKAVRKKKSKVPLLEELAASVEIDRLLDEANHEYYSPFWSKELDPKETLAAAKKKLGSIHLLRLLKTKMCTCCGKKLGMFFHRHGCDQGPNSQSCTSCSKDKSSRYSSNWTPGQAAKGLRLKGLNHLLSRDYRHRSVTTSGWCKGVELYDDETVTQAALAGYGSVWELHYGLAIYEKRRRKD